MLIRSSQNAHRYIEFRDNRICLIQTHEKDPTGLIRRLGQTIMVSVLVAAAMTVWLSNATAMAELPTGYQTVAGSASVQTDGTTMTITASNRAILNYQRFNIGAGNTVNILSPLSLHRVTGGNPSQILGNLNSTGKVFLVNPGGILFGAGARVNVQGLVASTLDIHNDDFLAGNYTFQRASGTQPGSITNLGHLNAADSIALLAGAVDNQGSMSAPQVHVAVGDQMRYQVNPDLTVDVTVDKALQQKVAGFQTAIQNSGSISGDLIQMRAKLAQAFYETTVNNEGIIKAQGLTMGTNGQIIAIGESADGQAVVENRGQINASGARGGFIHLEGNTTLNRGELLSTGATGTGGTIHMLGDTVANLGNAGIDVSGAQGGGTFLMGGDYQGQNSQIRNALYNFNDPGTRIVANALQQGNGGKVILWADNKTVFQGSIEAKGGLLGGNGGFVETSGRSTLQSLGTVDASATAGAAGQWLLDPNNITIQNAGSDTNVSSTGVNPITYGSTNDNAIVTSGTIQTALNNGTDVTIQTTSSGSNTQGGDINIDQGTTINKTTGGDATLTLKAHRSILFNGLSGAPITLASSSNRLNVILNADTDQGSDGGLGGAIKLDYTTITSNGGSITLGGGANALTTNAKGTSSNTNGIFLNGSTLSAGAGAISLRGTGYTAAANSLKGILLLNGSQVRTTTGNITMNGLGGAGIDNNYGIQIGGAGTLVSSEDGAISLIGTGGSNGSDINNFGLFVSSGGQVTSTGDAGTGSITLQGTGGNGVSTNYGFYISGANALVSSKTGNVSITGQAGNGSGGSNVGLVLGTDATVSSTGSATLTLNGTGGSAGTTNSNFGVYLNGVTQVTSGTGAISITGQGGNGSAGGNYGIYVRNGGQVSSTGSATVTMSGTGGNGTSTNYGIALIGSGSRVTGVSGLLSLTGTGKGSVDNNHGIYLSTDAQIGSTGSAGITLTGNKGTGSASRGLFSVTGSNLLGGNTMTGNLSLTADDVSLSNMQMRTAGEFLIKPYTASGTIGVNGGAGTLQLNSAFFNLLDTTTVSPSKLIIGNASAGTGAVTIGNNWNLSAYDSPLEVYGGSITTGGISVRGGRNLLLQARAGDINLNAGSTFSKTTGGDANFSLLASRSILLNGASGNGITIASTSNKLKVLLNADTDQGSDGGEGGAIKLDYTTITSNGGNMVLGGGANPLTTAARGTTANWDGVDLRYSTLSAGSGNISMRGAALNNAANGGQLGIRLVNGTQVSTTTGSIAVQGTGGNGTFTNHGIYMDGNGGNTTITTVDGAINVTGQGGNGSSDNNRGIFLVDGAQITSTGNGTVTVNGTGGTGTSANYGILIDGWGNRGNTLISTVNGAINLTGQGGNGSSDNNRGIFMVNGGQITSTGNGTVTVNGTGGTGTSNNYGILIDGWDGLASNTAISTVNGAINLTGQGGNGSSDNNRGIFMVNGGQITSTGNGTVTVNGTGGTGTSGNYGILIDGWGSLASNTAISTVNGAINLTGQGGNGSSNNNHGIYLANNGEITSTGAANITLTGIKGANTSTSLYSDTGSNLLGSNTMTGDLTLVANDYALSDIQLRTGGALVYKPRTASTTIGLNGGAGSLQLGTAFLSLLDTSTVSPSKLVFGDSSSGTGAVTIGNNWNMSGFSFPVELYGGSIATGSINMGANRLLMHARTGDLTIGAGATLTSTATGNAFVLAAGQNFHNNSGASALSASNGRWLVYSSSPLTSTEGGLSYIKRYNRTFAANGPSTITETGNMMLYSLAPTLTLTVDNASRLYGAANPGFTGTLSGFVDGDTAATSGITGSAVYTTAATSASNAGTYGVTATQGTLASMLGYEITTFAPGTLTINKAPLTVKANNQSRSFGQSNPAFPISYTGFVLGQDQSVLSGSASATTAATSASPVGSYTINLNSTLASPNYDITLQNGTLSVVSALAPSPAPAPSPSPSASTSSLTPGSIPYLLNPAQSPNTVAPASFLKIQSEFTKFQSDRNAHNSNAANSNPVTANETPPDSSGSINDADLLHEKMPLLPGFIRIDDENSRKNMHDKKLDK